MSPATITDKRCRWPPSFRSVVLASAFLRIALILYSEWHDAHSVVKYTDVDYRVFTDAAHFLLRPQQQADVAKGPLGPVLGFGDPYARETYRYTPLLALFMTPNHWLHPSFGKYLFAACDLLNGGLIYHLLQSAILPAVLRHKPNSNSRTQPHSTHALATFYASFHLLNPLVFSISTRGSAESILSTLVLLTLQFVMTERWDAAAIMLGLSVHWKIYPFIYGAASVSLLSTPNTMLAVINRRTLRFFVLSFGVFAALGILCYSIWGYVFLYETYLYHLHRLDHRHNFSPYFYLTYLTYPQPGLPAVQSSVTLWSAILRSSLISFVPQMCLTLLIGLLFGHRKDDAVFTWFMQTTIFVIFNKVCTSQYFLWYILFLPLLLPKLSMSITRAVVCVLVWVASQALWLGEAYKLEFLGRDVFLGLWLRSLVYVSSNVWVLGVIMKAYDTTAIHTERA